MSAMEGQTNAADTSSTHDVTDDVGLASRTQSYCSVASSQVSRQSTLPDYDFAEDERPGKYKPEKKNKKKKNTKGTKKQPKKHKAVKETKDKSKKGKESKEKTKKKKEPKAKGKKNKNLKDENKDGNEDDPGKSENSKDDFFTELESAVSSRRESTVDEGITSQSDVDMTSRDSSLSRGRRKKKKKDKKKAKKNKKKERGRSTSKKRKGSRASSELSIGNSDDLSNYVSDDVMDDTSQFSDYASRQSDVASSCASDEEKKSKSSLKKSKKKKKFGKKEGPTVITVNDETDEDVPSRKKVLGCIPVPSKKEPIVYNCCLCCSLGAGSLLTGIIYVLFSIGYLALRANELKKRNLSGIWVGKHLLPDVWRLLLVFGMITASLCLLVSLILLVASCIWGHKEHYKRLRKCIILWIICTFTAVLNNFGEVVYAHTMPVVKQGVVHSSDSSEEIKKITSTLWIITALHGAFFLYSFVVLISYLRLLKYMDSPKIGTTTKPADKANITNTTKIFPEIESKQPVLRPSKRTTSATSSVTTSMNTLNEIQEQKTANKPPTSTESNKKILPERRPQGLPTRSKSFNNDRIYENLSFQEAMTNGSLSRAESEISLHDLSPIENTESFKNVLNDITNDPTVFDNMTNPKPLKRMPTQRRERNSAMQDEEAIYVNTALPHSTKSGYSQVSKPVKRANSLSDIRGPVYDTPSSDTTFKSSLKKEKSRRVSEIEDEKPSRYSSKDTGFNSQASTISSSGSHPDINDMEKLADQLRKEQEALDKAGNCDPAVAENLTQMAMNALKLSEKILQEVKSNEKTKNEEPEPSLVDKKLFEATSKMASNFFESIATDRSSPSLNPIEEMFKMYGKDLCSQNPEMVNRYLMSYKNLQECKSRQQIPRQNENIPDIAEAVMNEQRPWVSILNPSEAVAAFNPMRNASMENPSGTVTPMSSSMFPPYPEENMRMTPSAFSQSQPNPTKPFHAVSHASGPPLPMSFLPIEYPQQNSASFQHDVMQFPNPQNSMLPYKAPPPQYDPRMTNHQGNRGNKMGQYPAKPYHPEDVYYDESECPYSCCYSYYDDYGSYYGDYGPYPQDYPGPEPIYGDMGKYSGPNWIPLGEPAYSTYPDSYYYTYDVWDEPAPPYTEKSQNGSGYYPRGNSSREEGQRPESRRSDGRRSRTSSRSYDKKSRSLSDLLDEDLYSDERYGTDGARGGRLSRSNSLLDSRASSRLAQWGIHNGDSRDTIGRPTSRGAKSESIARASSFHNLKDSKEAFLKGYKAALKEALKTLSKDGEDEFASKQQKRKTKEEFIQKFLSGIGERKRSTSLDRIFYRTQSFDRELPRTESKDSRHGSVSRADSQDYRSRDMRTISNGSTNISRHVTKPERSSRNASRASGNISRASERPTMSSRRMSKLSFRPASRPGHELIYDPYDDYRSSSLMPPTRDELDDFGFGRKSSLNSGFPNSRLGNSRNNDSDKHKDMFSGFEASVDVKLTSNLGRPPTRSRMSRPGSSRDNSNKAMKASDSYPASSEASFSEGNFYNKLDLEHSNPPPGGRTSTDMGYPEQSKNSEPSRFRNSSRNSEPAERSRSANSSRQMNNSNKNVLWFMGDDDKEPIYGSDFDGMKNDDMQRPASAGDNMNNKRVERSLSFPYREAKQRKRPEERLESFASAKRKVTFGSQPDVRERRERKRNHPVNNIAK